MNEMTNEEVRKKIAEAKGAEIRWCYTDIDGPREHQSLLERRDRKDVKEDDHNFKDWCIRAGRHTWEIAPNWPTDLAAAWKLLEEAETHGVGYELTDVHLGSGKITHECMLFDPIGGPNAKIYTGRADTAPLAIDFAWLAWKEGEK